MEGWKLGLKALAVYRDNCKVGQPLSVGGKKEEPKAAEAQSPARGPGHRGQPADPAPAAEPAAQHRPPASPSGGAKGYMTASSYPDDGLGEVFLKMCKQGSTLAGVMDAFSVAISIGLQYGVPLETYVEKFINMRFEPAGMTDDPDIRMATSVMDYIFRRLALDHLPYEERAALGIFSAGRAGRAAARRGPGRRCTSGRRRGAGPVRADRARRSRAPEPGRAAASRWTSTREPRSASPPTRRSA